MELGDNTLNNERPLLVNVVVQFFFWLKFFLNQFKIIKLVLLFYTSLIFPNLCLWQRSLCSNVGGIDPEKLYRATLRARYFA